MFMYTCHARRQQKQMPPNRAVFGDKYRKVPHTVPMKKEKLNQDLTCRRGKVGGEAVLEGVMMRCGDKIALTVRGEDGSLNIKESTFTSVRKKKKILNLPLIRGVVSFIESMIMSFGCLSDSAELLGIDEEMEETKFERWLREKFGKGILDVVMAVGMVLGLALGIGLFALLPTYLANLVSSALPALSSNWFVSLFAGVMRICIFVGYILLVSLMNDIKRTFQYHGAEHKSIACYELGYELTPENAAKCSRFHPRCGTSFIFVVLILSILVYAIVPHTWAWYVQSLVKICMLPIVMGLSFEYLMYAGKHENILTKILSAPGLWMQRITTREPDIQQLEVAITSIKLSMPEEFPGFDPKTYDRAKKETVTDTVDVNTEESTDAE